jgi:RNA polymerase sigma-70 factor (ECF subfamily)
VPPLGLPEQEIADAFQAVATHIAGFRRERAGDTFLGWLRTITRNNLHDHFRKLGREPGGAGGTEAQIRFARLPAPGVPEDGESGARDADAEHWLFSQALELLRGEFEGRTWQAFWRTTVDGSTANAVAQELGMSPGGVRVATSRVLRRLREELGDV